ncbi:MAG: CaiB/BaiF CoA transferase family protein [Burkholderiaceae bacterium]
MTESPLPGGPASSSSSDSAPAHASSPQPLAGIRVVEFSHMVMGPACGLMLADLGADVIKIEPAPDGDKTRRLAGSGAGYFPAYNRNKRSVMLDLTGEQGRRTARQLALQADVLIENFRPGGLDAMGLGYESLAADNPKLVYCSLKGFLAGPYEHRTALDEVVQMMSGLAYMTGPLGKPMRAGASVNDVMGGLFGALAILAALRERERSGRGQHVQSGLFENSVFLMGQHMMQQAVSGAPAQPMSVRRPAWGVYDIFETADDVPLFVGVVTDRQWEIFVAGFDDAELRRPEYATNNQRTAARAALIPHIATLLKSRSAAEVEALCERGGLPFARIGKPSDLFDDPHLNAGGGLLPITLPNGTATKAPALPIAFGGRRPGLRLDLPAPGADNAGIIGREDG